MWESSVIRAVHPAAASHIKVTEMPPRQHEGQAGVGWVRAILQGLLGTLRMVSCELRVTPPPVTEPALLTDCVPGYWRLPLRAVVWGGGRALRGRVGPAGTVCTFVPYSRGLPNALSTRLHGGTWAHRPGWRLTRLQPSPESCHAQPSPPWPRLQNPLSGASPMPSRDLRVRPVTPPRHQQ